MPFILQGGAGNVVNATTGNALQVSQVGPITTTFSRMDQSLDCFENVQTSMPHIEFEQTFTQVLPTTVWEQTAYGSGTISQSLNNTVQMSTIGAASGSGYWI